MAGIPAAGGGRGVAAPPLAVGVVGWAQDLAAAAGASAVMVGVGWVQAGGVG